MKYSGEDNPSEFAEKFAEITQSEGYHFDFSLNSLTIEVDKYLEQLSILTEEEKDLTKPLLTAYIGETLCRLYNGKWTGQYFGTDRTERNYYTCEVTFRDYNKYHFYPNHFISYYLANGKVDTGPFGTYIEKTVQNKII